MSSRLVSISTAVNRFGYGVAFHLSQGIASIGRDHQGLMVFSRVFYKILVPSQRVSKQNPKELKILMTDDRIALGVPSK
ncbi:MAG: hypothetical protein OXC03_00355 [Flavobacteriaceae bacterium]|nr:hypothetical protein [Flavobacteriaceae bacterium]